MSSSSSSSTSLPPLPAELILHILHLAYPPHAEDDYAGRSHNWSVTITSLKQVDQLARQSVEKRNKTRNLAFQLPSVPQEVAPREIRQALRLFPDVEHIRIIGNYDRTKLDDRYILLSDFELLPHLRSLGAEAYLDLDDAALPRLEVLRTPYFGQDVDVPMHINSNNTPVLRHLSIQYLYPNSQPGSLIDLLDGFEVDVELTEEHDVVLQHRFRHVLFKALAGHLTRHQLYACFDSAVPYPPRHLQLCEPFISWSILDNIFLLPHRPESLFLPLLPPASSTQNGLDQPTRNAFLKRCKDEGVEVRWYRQAKEEWREVGCREFREYVEERKRREEGA